MDENKMILSEMEIDAIGEVLNISMGAAATAVSSMLDKQVVITTPKVTVETVESIDYSTLEPAMIVKITYVEGITGSNVMVFRQRDMQLILNQLMGIDEPPVDDFVFDELSMSAACEVMNQMMGSSATALSDFLGKTINISTPFASIMDDQNTFKNAVGFAADEDVICVVFNLTISDIMKSEFVSVMSCDLARMIVKQFLGDASEETIAPPPQTAAPMTPPPTPPPQVQIPMQPPVDTSQQLQMPQQTAGMQMPQGGQMQGGMPQGGQMQGGMPQGGQMQGGMPMQMPGMPPMGYMPAEYQQGYMPYPPYYGYPPMQGYPQMTPESPQSNTPPVNVQNVRMPTFAPSPPTGKGSGNMELIMNVPLNVSVEIGKTRKKIKDIMDFTQGTVIELEKQAGAPVDIIVNGQLLARGDVVVIDDNFGVRITEIVGMKEILNSLDTNK